MSLASMSKTTRGTGVALTCLCVYSYPQQLLKKHVVIAPNLEPTFSTSSVLSSSAQTWTWESWVKMLLLVSVANLSGDSTKTLQPRGETANKSGFKHCEEGKDTQLLSRSSTSMMSSRDVSCAVVFSNSWMFPYRSITMTRWGDLCCLPRTPSRDSLMDWPSSNDCMKVLKWWILFSALKRMWLLQQHHEPSLSQESPRYFAWARNTHLDFVYKDLYHVRVESNHQGFPSNVTFVIFSVTEMSKVILILKASWHWQCD